MTERRPRLHFSPASGWINDPNGLIRVDGIYHLFFQANPHGLVHGPMHWGHASSRDLATWEELPIALYPDVQGQCFSGSAIAAREGHVAPELGAGDGILLFYTEHRDREGEAALEHQCVAVADRTMHTFRKYAANPVITNPGLIDFRDPKVFWHRETARWVMVVTHGQSIGIYSSVDALNWRFESEFGSHHGRHGSGPWECPDLFPIKISGTAAVAWILMVGIGSGHISGGSGTQYFVGDFDGRTFVNRARAETELLLDAGRDFYAAQSFSGTGSEDPLVLAWMSNWDYANHTPATTFRGSMTLPRRLRLIETWQGLRLGPQVDPAVAQQFPRHVLRPGTALSPASSTYSLHFDWEADTGQRLDLALFGETEPMLTVERSTATDTCRIRLHRADHNDIPAGGRFGFRYDFEVSAEGRFDLDVFVDGGLVEIGCCGGRYWMSDIFFPDVPEGTVRLTMS